MNKTLFLLLLFLIIFVSSVSGQTYVFPINPGKTCYLTGSVGEIRQSHFHAGLDIAASSNTPVHASADGYISRIKISTYGYGSVIYITHPATRHQTVYGHLQEFNASLNTYMRQQQYAQERFEIDIYPDSNALPVKRGEVIAYSGNTGSSAGPHLHYEIRTMDDVTLNPMDFGFKELPPDNLPPLIRGMALQPFDIGSLVQGQFERREFKLSKLGKSQYTINKVLPVWGKIGLEVLTHDVMNKAYNTYGTTELEVWLDKEKIYTHNFNRISHKFNRCMNVHVNYEIYRKTGRSFQKCYIPDGFWFEDNYKEVKKKGYIFIEDEKVHEVYLIAKDPQGNKSTLAFKLKGKRPQPVVFVADTSPAGSSVDSQIEDNVLMIRAKNLKEKGDSARLLFNGIVQSLPLAYMQGKTAVYLWDLRKGLPDLIKIGEVQHHFSLNMLVPSGEDTFYKAAGVRVHFPKEALFDTLYLKTSVGETSFTLGDASVPLFQAVSVTWRPENIPAIKDKTAMYYAGHRRQKSVWKDSILTFQTRFLGEHILKRDVIPPVIRLLNKNAGQVRFSIQDDLSGIATFKATLNGKFLLMNYEHKRGVLSSKTAEATTLLKGTLILEVQDGAGNQQVFQTLL